MRERIQLQPHERLQIAAARRIGDKALEVIDLTYGSGSPLWTPGSKSLAYHNGGHGRAVGRDGRRVAEAVGLDSVDQALAEALGNAHDIIQETGRGHDERASGDWAAAALEATRLFPPAKIQMAHIAIECTEPIFDTEGRFIGQKVNERDFPDKTTELVAKSVSSGDLGGLYTPPGPHDGHQYFSELHPDLSIEKLITFQRNQLYLLETYRYPLAEAEAILATHRSEVIAHSQAMLDDLEAGTIASWDELIRLDKEFMRRHS